MANQELKKEYQTSIFNDVIGPVMRGPSSSHAAASARIGSLIRMAANGKIASVVIDFDINGSLAKTHDGQGSDMGIASGFLGFDLTDARVPNAVKIAKESGIDIQINILDYGAEHPNNYRINVLTTDRRSHNWEAISSGGGMVKLWKFNGFDINIIGDYYELLIISEDMNIQSFIDENINDYEYIKVCKHNELTCVNVKTRKKLDDTLLKRIKNLAHVKEIIELEPVLPILSKKDVAIPFSSPDEFLQFTKNDKRDLWQYAALYESIRGSITEKEVFLKMSALVDIFFRCVNEGLAGTQYDDRILGLQAKLIDEALKKNTLLPFGGVNNIIKYITAIMEVKSSMGVIIAAPTAGSCGCLPGTLLGVAEELHIQKDELVKAFLASSLIGVFIANGSGFAAEVGGCQVECGAGSAMAAAGIVQLMGGTVAQCLDAAAMALQNVSGLACDMVANRTEVPCLGKNIMCGLNALACATMSAAGFRNVISLGETIEAIADIGKSLPASLRCTLGGLGKTKSSIDIAKRLL